MALMGKPIWNLDSSVRSRTPHPASSVTRRWAVETGKQVSRAISVSECSLPSRNASKIATILLVTDRPGSAELPAIGPPPCQRNESANKHVLGKGRASPRFWRDRPDALPDGSGACGKPRGPFSRQRPPQTAPRREGDRLLAAP